MEQKGCLVLFYNKGVKVSIQFIVKNEVDSELYKLQQPHCCQVQLVIK